MNFGEVQEIYCNHHIDHLLLIAAMTASACAM